MFIRRFSLLNKAKPLDNNVDVCVAFAVIQVGQNKTNNYNIVLVERNKCSCNVVVMLASICSNRQQT